MATRRVLRNAKSRTGFVATQNHITTLHALDSVEDLATGETNDNTVRMFSSGLWIRKYVNLFSYDQISRLYFTIFKTVDIYFRI